MIIKTITCHDVYNVGASLQAYALQTYLANQEHDVEIIDYKPEYLSRHYSLKYVANPKYDKPLVKQMYLLAKLPQRKQRLNSQKKVQFDRFRSDYLKLTAKQYHSNDELKRSEIKADVFVAGSDQIWNPLFENGKDPSFFLDFVKVGKKISYAASFAVDSLPDLIKAQDRNWLKDFDAVSVREKSGVDILNDLEITGYQVCDPVFLLDRDTWLSFLKTDNNGNDKTTESTHKYIYLYDFDGAAVIDDVVEKISMRTDNKVWSYFGNHSADVAEEVGPIEFLRNLNGADTIVSNSFHATAFSLILHKDFYVVGRKEAINARMQDLLRDVGLEDRYIIDVSELDHVKPIDWESVDYKLKQRITESKVFLHQAINE